MSKSKFWTSQSIRSLARQRLEVKKSSGQQVSFSGDENLESKIIPTGTEKKFDWGQFQTSHGNRVFFVGVNSKNSEDDNFNFEEMKSLIHTLGLHLVGQKILNLRSGPQSATYLGKGQLEALKSDLEGCGAVALILDAPLSPGQVKNIEKILGSPVVDREGLIISIFEDHAQSSVSKIQVELAKLKYLQPRLSGIWSGLSRQRGAAGGLGGRGLGETRLELDRRVIKERISQLNKRLKVAEKSLFVQSHRRSNSFRSAIVGYTNAGKSSLMNRLTRAGVEESDRLFATLDARVKVLNPPVNPPILVSDTVGFVKKLPPSLLVSFKSTLLQAYESDVLIHVLDASLDPARVLEHYSLTLDILGQIKSESEILSDNEKPLKQIVILNKVDLLGHARIARLVDLKRRIRGFKSDKISAEIVDIVPVSTLDLEGVDLVRASLLSVQKESALSFSSSEGASA